MNSPRLEFSIQVGASNFYKRTTKTRNAVQHARALWKILANWSMRWFCLALLSLYTFLQQIHLYFTWKNSSCGLNIYESCASWLSIHCYKWSAAVRYCTPTFTRISSMASNFYMGKSCGLSIKSCVPLLCTHSVCVHPPLYACLEYMVPISTRKRAGG